MIVLCVMKKAVVGWLIPRAVHDVKWFQVLAKFYRNFVGKYASLETPLSNLTRVGHKWSRLAKCQRAFEKMKEILPSKRF